VPVFDDRAFNKEGFSQDRDGHRTLVATSLDLIEEQRVNAND
jgi:hypothetical protein